VTYLLSLLLFWLFAVLASVAVFAVSIYGLVLAFKASILVGVLALFVEPAPLVIGLVYLFMNINLAQKLANLLF
jgi:hypothetical protein